MRSRIKKLQCADSKSNIICICITAPTTLGKIRGGWGLGVNRRWLGKRAGERTSPYEVADGQEAVEEDRDSAQEAGK